MHSIEELQQFLVINKDVLEEELVRQPQLFYEVSELYSDACNKKDVSKQILEQMAADLANQFRVDSVNEGRKATAAEVDSHVTSHPNYVRQYQLHLQYKSLAERMQGLKDSFAQRSSMLRDLVSLMSIGFWGTGINVDEGRKQAFAEKYRSRFAGKDLTSEVKNG